MRVVVGLKTYTVVFLLSTQMVRISRKSQRILSSSALMIAGCVLIVALAFSLILLFGGEGSSYADRHHIFRYGAKPQPPEWCNKTPPNKSTSFKEGRFQIDWRKIDEITSSEEYEDLKVSGGLFLYPRQTMSLSQVVLDLILSRDGSKKEEKKQVDPLTVCETGFGAGHSAAFFLSISPAVEVVTFDKFDRPYQIPIFDKLKQKFHERIEHVKGNSCDTVPKFMKNTSGTNDSNGFRGCDFLHGSSLCPSDNIDLVQHAKCGLILTSTAMHSLIDKDVYFGPNAQWRKLRDDGCITDITCFSENSMTLDRSFVFAAEKTKISHKFCFAVVTGACHYSKNTKNRQQVEDRTNDAYQCDVRVRTAREILGRLCPDDRIDVPL